MSVQPGRYDIFQAGRYWFALETGCITRVQAWPENDRPAPDGRFTLVDADAADPTVICPLTGNRVRLPLALSLRPPVPARLIADTLVAVNLQPAQVLPAEDLFARFTGLGFIRALLLWPGGEALLIDPARLLDSLRPRRPHELSS